jgi:hypothetical protein
MAALRDTYQLTMENDFLKKALQHFRDHHPPAVVSGADACLEKSSKPAPRPPQQQCHRASILLALTALISP